MAEKTINELNADNAVLRRELELQRTDAIKYAEEQAAIIAKMRGPLEEKIKMLDNEVTQLRESGTRMAEAFAKCEIARDEAIAHKNMRDDEYARECEQHGRLQAKFADMKQEIADIANRGKKLVDMVQTIPVAGAVPASGRDAIVADLTAVFVNLSNIAK